MGHCREGSIAHFQGWKRNYHVFTTRLPPRMAHAMVLTEMGIIPLKLALPGVKTFSESFPSKDDLIFEAGRIRKGELRGSRPYLSSLTDTVPAAVVSGKEQDSIEQRDSFVVAIPEPTATAYCVGFSEDLKTCTRYLFGENLSILAAAPVISGSPANDCITLISVGWLQEYVSGLYDALLSSWSPECPVILVLAVASDGEAVSFVADATASRTTIIAVNIGRTDSGGADESLVLPDKTLLNIGMDAADTELVLLAPSNVRLVPFADALQEGLAQMLRRGWQTLHRGNRDHNHPAAQVLPMFSPSVHDISLNYEPYPSLSRATHAANVCAQKQPEHLRLSWPSGRLGKDTTIPFNSLVKIYTVGILLLSKLYVF